MRLSNNFELSEFTESDTAKRYGISNDILEAAVLDNLKALVTDVLQPLRDAWGEPIHINSGYRSPRVNQLVGGVSTSQHTRGEASDLKTDDPYRMAKMIVDLNLPFDQVILYPTFVHVSHKRNYSANRHNVLYNYRYKGQRL